MKTGILATCLFLFVVFAFKSLGQTSSADTYYNIQSITSGSSMFRTYDYRFKGMKGSPKLLPDYVLGRIVMRSGMKVKHDRVNFDSYNGELMVIQNGIESVVNMALVTYFVLEPTAADTMHFEKIQDVDGKLRFFQTLYQGKQISLFKKHWQTLIQPNNTGAYSAGRDYAELVPEQTYFVMVRKELKTFKNKKTFLEMLPDYKARAESFIKQEKVDFKNEQAVTRLVEFLDSQ